MVVLPEIPQLVAAQVKEKFGTLRFYYDGGDDYTYGVVALAEELSASTCEICGHGANLYKRQGWLKTLCDVHAKEHGYERSMV